MTQTRAGRRESFGAYLAAHAAMQPAVEAAIEGDVRLDYAALAGLVDAVCAGLRDRGAERGHVIGYMGPPGIQFLVSLLATLATGATWIGLNPRYRAGELAHVMTDARPALVILASTTDAQARSELQAAIASCDAAPALLQLAGMHELPGRLRSIAPLPAAQAEIAAIGAAVLVYTSGSTGRPKGACLTSSNLVENAWWLARRLADPGGRMLINLPVNHVGCIADTALVGLLQGNTLVFMPGFDPCRAAELIRDERITTVGQVPTQYQMMQAAGVLTPAYLGSLRHLAWGGAAMPQALIEELSPMVPDLFNGYGLTESTGTVTVTPSGASLEQLAQSVGLPFVPGSVRIADGDGCVLAQGEAGEIQIRGRHVFAGYLRNPDANRRAFTADGWLRTGDLGRWRSDGTLHLAGRQGDMFKSGGYNVYPREIEIVLEACPGVVMAAVIGVADPLWGESGVAFVYAEPGIVSPESLAAWCRQRLAAYKTPKRFLVRPDLPLLPVGKIDRKGLPALLQQIDRGSYR